MLLRYLPGTTRNIADRALIVRRRTLSDLQDELRNFLRFAILENADLRDSPVSPSLRMCRSIITSFSL
ncbi:MAG: hypothetical protein LBR89_02035 [Holosporales bacterium]|nr:hypothetical protein [Holosporales bacterium]